MKAMTSNRSNREQGSILVWMSLMSVLILSFLALAFDGGYFYQQKRRMQTAADSAALAGAMEKKRNPDVTTTDVVNMGRQDAATNGFTHGSSNITVAINQPPTSGTYAGNNDYVEALITQQHQSFFASLFNLLTPSGSGNFNQVSIRARAVAGTAKDSDCIHILHPSAPAAFDIRSNTTLNAGCGVQINSTSSTALSVTSGSLLSSADIEITGNYQALSGSTVSPTPEIGQTAIPDPLSWLLAPTIGSCNFNNVTVDLPEATSTTTLQPGVYCGGIEIKKGRVTLAPGQYIMVGTSDRGGLVVGSSDSRLDGNGVFIYNHISPCASGPEKCRIYVKSGATMSLSAMETGYYAGIAIFQQRALLDNPLMEIRFESGSHVGIHGTVYVPFHEYVHHSDAAGLSTTPWTAVVARTMEVSSNSAVGINANSSPVPNPLRRIALVE